MARSSDIALATSRVLAALSLFLFAGFRYGEPMWLLAPDVLIVAAIFSLAMLISVPLYVSRFFQARNQIETLAIHAAVVLLVAASIVGTYYVADLQVSRLVLIYEPVLLFGLLLLNYSRFHKRMILSVNIAVFAVAVYPSLSASSISSFKETVLGNQSVQFDDSADYLFSSRHDLKITNYPILESPRGVRGGGLIVLDQSRLLVGTGDVEFLVVMINNGSVTISETAIEAPINTDDYLRQTDNPSRHFRVTDVFMKESIQRTRSLFVSHHHWNTSNDCLTLRLSEKRIDIQTMLEIDSSWKTRYESAPCLSLMDDFLSNQNGGRIDFLPPHSILLTIGTHEYDSQVKELADFDRSSYGKIVEINTENWSSAVFSRGHRNPQGLLVTDSSIWATEHGPHGGDELNLIERGGDYGWPLSTYGTAYGQKSWYRIVGQDEHVIGRKPIYAWVPSIGVSNLLQIKGPAFSAWQGDLIVSSLIGLGNGKSLFRVKIEDERVILIERMVTGLPVRDLVELHNGHLILWDGNYSLQLVEPASHVFSECSGCHALRWNSHGIGPDLMGIVGDRVGRWPDFAYSEALSRFGGRWTTERLDAYLRDPADVVPGTSMKFEGIKDPKRRAEIIEYLAELSTR